jgi:hypothetical protein
MTRQTVAALLNVSLAAALVTTGPVQGAPPAAAGNSAERTGLPPMEVPPVNGTSSDTQTHPVLRITSVEVIRSSHPPFMDIIRARGLASSTGWEEAELVPLTRGVPADGVLQLIMVARPPETAADATGYESVEAIFPLETNHPFKGVNVHGATNAVSVTEIPGYTESKAVADDCGKCVGKIVLAKGGSSAAARADALREDQLPPETRIVRPSEGMMGATSNPNRLTLILDKDNRIVAAVWE